MLNQSFGTAVFGTWRLTAFSTGLDGEYITQGSFHIFIRRENAFPSCLCGVQETGSSILLNNLA